MKTTTKRLLLALTLYAPTLRAGNLLVDVHNFASANIVNRRVTITLLDPGPVTAGPWLLAGDSVAQFTDTNGITVFTNVLAGGYRLDIAGSPSRSFPFGMPDTNSIPNGVTTNVVGLIGATNTMPWFYTAAQIDAILSTNYGTAAGTNVVVQTNAPGGHTYTINVPVDANSFSTNANGLTLAPTATNAFAVKLNNGADFSTPRNVGANVGVAMLSPVNGNNGISDATNATPAFDGQLGVSYFGGGGRSNVYMWNSIGTSSFGASKPWGGGWAWPGGFNSIGLQNSMAIPSPPSSFSWYLNGNTNAMSREYVQPTTNSPIVDAVWYFWNMNPYTDSQICIPAVDTNHVGTAFATNSDGVPIYVVNQFGMQIGFIPNADVAGEVNEAGSYDILTGAGDYPFYICQNSTYGGVNGQYYTLGLDERYWTNSTYHFGWHFPVLVANCFTFTNSHNLDALFVDLITGLINTYTNVQIGNGGGLEQNWNVANADLGHGLDINSNASFNALPNVNSAWTFDGSGTHRLGIWQKQGQFTKHAHGNGTPWTVTQNTSGSDLLANQAGSQIDELLVGADGSVTVLAANLVVSNAHNLIVSSGVTGIGTSTPVSTLEVAGTLGLRVWTTNNSFTIATNLAISTLMLTKTNLTITLPDATACSNRVYTFKQQANSAAALATTSSQKIDGTSTTPAYTIPAQYGAVTVQSDGVQWWVLSKF